MKLSVCTVAFSLALGVSEMYFTGKKKKNSSTLNPTSSILLSSETESRLSVMFS